MLSLKVRVSDSTPSNQAGAESYVRYLLLVHTRCLDYQSVQEEASVPPRERLVSESRCMRPAMSAVNCLVDNDDPVSHAVVSVL
jgi:hypothetical protein